MKQAIIILCMLTLATSVFAQGNGNGAGGTQAQTGDPNLIQTQTQMHQFESKVTGLENAMLRVQKEEQKQHLEQVLAKIQEKRQQRLNKLDNLQITEHESGVILAKGKDDAKLLGLIKFKKTFRYQVQEDGSLTYMPEWYDGLCSFEK